MKVRQALMAAASLIERGGWVQWQLATNASGECRSPDAEDAVNFCASGALLRVIPQGSLANLYAGVRFQRVLGESLISFNDKRGRTRAQVVRAMRRAARPFPLYYLP